MAPVPNILLWPTCNVSFGYMTTTIVYGLSFLESTKNISWRIFMLGVIDTSINKIACRKTQDLYFLTFLAVIPPT